MAVENQSGLLVVSDVVTNPESLGQYSVKLLRDDGELVVEVPVVGVELSLFVSVRLHSVPVPADALDHQSCGRIQLCRYGVVITDGNAGPSTHITTPQNSVISFGVPLGALPQTVQDKVAGDLVSRERLGAIQRLRNWLFGSKT